MKTINKEKSNALDTYSTLKGFQAIMHCLKTLFSCFNVTFHELFLFYNLQTVQYRESFVNYNGN